MFSNILPFIRFPFRWTPTIKVSSKVSAAFLVIVWACFGPIFSSYAQACPTGTSQLIVVIRTDNYPRESSYRLQNQSGATLAFRDTGYFTQTATYYRDTLCIPNTSCLTFTMMDSYGDGLCCGHGNGLFQLWWNGNLLASGGQFTHSDVRSLNCAPT
ncbi:MAG: hypothetical protein ACKO9W_05510, partial [Bacteroidota bacterium]